MVLETYVTILGRDMSFAASAGGAGGVSAPSAAPAGGGGGGGRPSAGSAGGGGGAVYHITPPPPPAEPAEVLFNLLQIISHTFVSYYYCIENWGKCRGAYCFVR